jgi:GAF domain-containing protein
MNNVNELHEALARMVLADREPSEVLTEITGIARRAMPSVEAASITLIRGEKPFTAAYDGQMALDADELQYERGYGPCVDAGRAGQMFLVDDMRTEQRWPDYAQNVLAHGVLSSLSVPLPFQGVTIGALDTTPGSQRFSTTLMLSWPKRLLPGSRSQSAMRKQQPGPAMISFSCASR